MTELHDVYDRKGTKLNVKHMTRTSETNQRLKIRLHACVRDDCTQHVIYFKRTSKTTLNYLHNVSRTSIPYRNSKIVHNGTTVRIFANKLHDTELQQQNPTVRNTTSLTATSNVLVNGLFGAL